MIRWRQASGRAGQVILVPITHNQSQPVAVLSSPLHSPKAANQANHYFSLSNASCSLSCLACLFRAFVLHLKLQDTWKGLLKSLEWCVLFFFQQGLEILSHCFVNWTGRLPFYLWQLNNGVKSGKTRDKKLRSLYRLSSCTELCTVLILRFERGRELCWQLLGLWPACFLIFPNERTLCFVNVDVPNKQTTIKPRCK